MGTRQSVTSSPPPPGAALKASPTPSGSPQNVDPEMLKNLDMLSDMEVLKDESKWDALKHVPSKAYDDPETLYKKMDVPSPEEE